MNPLPSERTVLARHDTADGEIQLQQRLRPDGSAAFEIISNGVFLMASYNQDSERALASYAFEMVSSGSRAERRVLIGGLGMGISLQEILTQKVTAVDVVEISPHIVEWNRSYFAYLNNDALADSRVMLIQDDLFDILTTSSPTRYSAILLDVDNGPSWVVYEKNDRLYTSNALKRWSAMLAPGGVLAIWSAQPEPEFLERMKTEFGHAEEATIVTPNIHGEPTENFIYCGLKNRHVSEVLKRK